MVFSHASIKRKQKINWRLVMGIEETKEVHLMCPTCRARVTFQVPTYVFHGRENGIATIQVQSDVCAHQFLLMVDQNYSVRGTEKVDFEVTLEPQRQDIVDLNFGDVLFRFKSYATACLLHAVIFNYPIQIVTSARDQPNLYQQLKTLFTSILPPEWQKCVEITQISTRDFQKLPQSQKDVLIVDTEGIIINMPWKEEKIQFEKNLLSAITGYHNVKIQLDTIRVGVEELFDFMQAAADLVRGKNSIFDTEMDDFIDAKGPVKKGRGFLSYLLKLFDRRLLDDPSLCKKVRLKTIDSMLKSLWF
ncbi:MAG: hypothetical protein RBG13Loki_3538 [Promethearchaeota archaeon CR_4]|nr:MAG: hypothetical protein RBG13Loki_3538 [Candidatus Lokiarchaeota archaeon CR_4]